MNRAPLGFFVALALAAACGSDTDDTDSAQNVGVPDMGATSTADATTTTDASRNVGPGPDAGVTDTGSPKDMSADSGPNTPPNILLFSRTEGFRHGSINDAIPAIEARAQARGWSTTATEDPEVFSGDTLSEFDAIVFVMTTGNILDDSQRLALEQFVSRGGGWAGIHSASDTEYDWAWYGGLVGAYFSNHPSIQEAELTVEVAEHASTAHLPGTWTRRDEWYNFRDNPRANVTVLITIDESTYEGGSMGDDHPMAWCHDYAGGRSWYTAGGHTRDSYADDDFMEHVMGGIAYAAGEGSCE